MKPKQIGTFPLAHLNVALYVSEGSDGKFEFAPDEKQIPRITIGLDSSWLETIQTLLHETLEFCLSLNNHRWQHEIGGDAASYLFNFTHGDLTRLCQHQGQFIMHCLPDLATHHKKFNRRKKK